MSSTGALKTSCKQRVEGKPASQAKAHPLFMAAALLLKAALLLATLAAIITALVHRGKRSRSALNAVCNSRLGDSVGFDGDPDFYGLGVRLGVYLQWLTDLITTGYLEEDRRYVLMTYHIFSISITVALFIKIFTSACTFSAEVFIVLVLFWGGYNVVQLPMTRAMSLSNIFQFRKEDLAQSRIPRLSRKLRWSMQLLNFIMSPITVWFWTRIAAAEGADFASTPGGTAYFFFARIHGRALKPFSIFMAIASAISFFWSVYVLVPTPSWMFDSGNGADVSSYLITVIWAPLFAVFWLPSLILTLWDTFLMVALYPCVEVFTYFLRILHGPIEVNHETGVSRVPTLESGKDGRSDFDQEIRVQELIIKFEGVTPFLIAVWCIIAIELTLLWNSVSHVYDVESAGQIIPLVTGISGLLDTISKKEIFQGKPRQEYTGEKTHRSISKAIMQPSSHSIPNTPQ